MRVVNVSLLLNALSTLANNFEKVENVCVCVLLFIALQLRNGNNTFPENQFLTAAIH